MRVLQDADGVSAEGTAPPNSIPKGVQGPTSASYRDAGWPSKPPNHRYRGCGVLQLMVFG